MPTATLTPSASSPYVAGNKGAYNFNVTGGMLASSIYCTGAAITADDGNDSLYIARSSPPRSFMATVAMKMAGNKRNDCELNIFSSARFK